MEMFDVNDFIAGGDGYGGETPMQSSHDFDVNDFVSGGDGYGGGTTDPGTSAAPRKLTREERIAQNQRAIERAQHPGEGENGFGTAFLEGLKGAGRAVKSVGEGIVGMGSGAVRLAGTPVRMLTGWEGLHKLADTIDQSYANFGADALMSDYGEDPDGWGFALGRFGEKLAGTAGSLAALGGVSKGIGLVDKALKAAGHTKTAAAVSNLLPAMFGNDAAVRAYDTARKNEKSRTEAAALAGMNGAIHFFGFKAFENKALNKMLGMPAELNSSLPTWATQAMEARAPHSFSDLVRGMRNGMIKYTLAERGKGALRAGGIMAVQDMLSDVPMQVAEGGSWDDIDFNRVGKKGLHGLVEGGLMEGSLGAAAILRSNSAAKKFVADKFYRGENYKVAGPDGREYTEPGLLNTPQGRMLLMKQNPAATERVLDIVEHGGKPRAEELDAAFLPSDMNETELRRFAADWREDLRPYVDEAWAADAPRQTAAPDAAAKPGRDMLSPEEAQSQQKAANDAAERQKVADRRAAADSMMLDFESWNRLYVDGKTDLNFDEWRAAGKPGVIEANLTPKTEEAPTSETRANEEQAQPEQAPARPEVVAEEPRPVEAEQPQAEATDARVVESPAKPAEAAQKPAEAAVEPKVGEDTLRPAEGVEGKESASAANGKPTMGKVEASIAGPQGYSMSGAITDPAHIAGVKKLDSEHDIVEVLSPPAVNNSGTMYVDVVERKNGKLFGGTYYVDTAGDMYHPVEHGLKGGTKDHLQEWLGTRYTPQEREAKLREWEGKPAEAASRVSYATPEREAPASTATEPVFENEQLEKAYRMIQSGVAKDVKAGEALAQETVGKMKGRDLDRLEGLPGNDKASRTILDIASGERSDRWISDEPIDPDGPTPDPVVKPVKPTTGNTLKPATTASPTNRLKRADGTDPLAEKEKAEPKPGAMSPTQKRNRLAKVQGIVDKIDPDLAIDTKALRYGQNNPDGFVLKDLKMLDDPANDGWQYELGLPKERADELRKAVHDAYEEQRMASPNRKDKANKTGQDTYSVSASQALERLAAKPNDFKRLGIAHEQVSAAAEAAKRQGDEQGAKFWEDRLSSLNQQIENLAPHEQAKVDNAIQAMQTKKSAMERKDTQSLETGEGKTLDVAASEEDVAQTNSIKGSGGKGGSLEGNRHLRIDKIEGDKLTVTLMDAAGKPLGPSRPMKRAEWEILGKAAKTNDNIDGDPSNPQKGDMLRMSRGEAETPEARDLRFKTDADYQKWLKDRGANDAPIMRERYEGEQAKIAAKAGRNFFLGTDVKLDAIDREYNPETDGGKKIVDQDSGRVVGTFNRDTNEIKLFRGANVKTLVHELGGHAVRKYAEQLAAQGDRKLLDRIDRVIDEAEKFAPEIVKSVKERYPDAKGDELRDEIWAALRERHSEAMEKTVRTLQGKAWYNRAWAAFKEAWQGILAKMGFNRADLSKINRMDHDEFLDFLDKTMAEGKTLGILGETSEPAKNSTIREGRRTNGFSGVDTYGKISSIKLTRKENQNELQTQGNRLSEQGNSDGMGGEPAAVESGDRLLAGASAIGRGVEGRVQESTRVRDKEAESQARLIEYAKKNGVWDGNIEQTLDKRYGTGEGQKNTDGGEAIVWFDRKRGVAVKAIGLDYYGSPMLALERIQLHNKYFPDTKLSLVGFGEIPDVVGRNGEVELYGRPFNMVAEQPLIDSAQELTKSEIRSRLEAQGFKFLKDHGEAGIEMETPDGKAIVSDLHERNVFAGSRGATKVIDCDIRLKPGRMLNLYTSREQTDFPPEQIKTPEGEDLGKLAPSGASNSSSSGDAQILSNSVEADKGVSEEKSSPPVRESRAPKPAGYKIMDDQQTKGEKFKEKFLDRLASVESVQDEIGGVKEIVGADGYTDHRKSTDYVAAADKANGRIEHEMRDLQHRSASVDKTLSEAALKGQSTADLVSDFDLYLQCKHAPERNRTIAERNGVTYDADYYYGMGKVPLPGGNSVGLSENVANRLLRGLEGKYGSLDKFEEAAQKVYEINRADIQRRVEAGRLTPQDANQYLYRWQRYVPLKTDMERLEPEGFNSSTASMRRNEFMKAQGRANADIADSPLAASILQAEQGIRGAIKNELANVGANLVEHAAAQGKPIGEIVRGEMLPKGAGWTFTLDDGTRVTVGGSMKLAENRPDVHLFKRDGELMAYRIDKGANGRGLAFSRAMSGENMGKWGNGMEWVPKMTAWMSAMRTQYSPEFTVSNLLADHLEAYQALVGRYGIKGGTAAFGKMVASEIQNAKDLKNYLKTGMMSRDVGEAVRAGLLTKGGVASEGFEGKEQSIRNRIEDFRRKERKWRDMSAADWAKGGWQNVTEFISFANEMAEYSTRMGIFSALKKQGVPVKDAVKFARDATVNFNRKGTAMPLINGLYMFANASVQGAMRSVQAMRDEHGKELVALLVGVGVAKAVIDHYLGNDDDRDKKGGRNARNLSEYDRKHNVGVPVGGGYQFVPFRFRGPYAAIPYLAQTAANVALGERTPKAGVLSLVRELGDQVTDIVGGNGIMNDKGEFDGSLAMQSIAPSVVDPFVQLASGKDYKGDDRKARTFDKTTPVSSNGRRSTSEIYKGMAEGLNWLSGGNEFRKGLVDVAPEDLQLVLEFLGGGPMRDAHNTVATAHNVAQRVAGGTPERTLSQVPFVRRIVKEYPENTSRYYDALDGYERDKAEFKKTVDLKRRAEFGRAHPYVRPMPDSAKSRVDVLAERIKELTHLERGEVKSGQKWVERKTPLAESQKEMFRKRRLELQAKVLGLLGG